MGRALKVVVAVLVLLAVVAFVLPSLFRSGSGGPGPGPVSEVGEERGYPLLATLNYTLVGAREHARWIWSALGEYSQDDPVIASYLEWLGWALVGFRVRPHVYGDYIAVDTPGYREVVTYLGKDVVHVSYVPAKQGMLPANDSKVRMGFVRMPFGYGIVVTAYQDDDGQVIVVIHGTVVDEAEFIELAVRTLAYPVIGAPPMPQGLQACAEPAMDECTENPWLIVHRRFNFTVYWFLWRTMIPGKGYLEVNETLRIPIREVYLLIEMPVLGANPPPPGRELVAGSRVFGCLDMGEDLRAMVVEKFGTWCMDTTITFEPVYLALSHPVFGLASNFANVNEQEAERLATYGVGYREPYYGFRTILTARLVGKVVCEGASSSTAMSASLFGYPAIVSTGRSWIHGGVLHDISGYLRLSSMGEQGTVQLVVDVDGDGVLDSYDVLKDVGLLPMNNIMSEFTNTTAYCPPLVCVGMPGIKDVYDYFATYADISMSLIGVPQVVLRAPDWLKTPAMVRYQWLTERLVSESLSNVVRIAEMKPFGTDWIYGYAYDEERDAFVPVGNRTYVYPIPSDRFPLLIEPAIRTIFAEKGVGPGLFAPPSAQHIRPVVGYLPVLHEDREIPSTRRYLVEGFRRLAEERVRQLEGYSPFVRPAEPEPPKPVEVEVALEPVYVEVPFYLSETESIVARAFDRWEGRVVVEGNEYTVRLYLSQRYDRPGEYVYVLEVERFVGWYTWGWQTYYQELPANGTRVELYLEGRRVVLTVYYKPAELPDIGLIEVSEDVLTLYQEYKYAENGELMKGRVYVINATTIRGAPALIAQRNSTVVVVFGSVGTLDAGVSVQVYGTPTRIRYTVTAELVLPNGTAIPLKLNWWSPNPPDTGFIYVSTNTYDLPRMKLSGATLKITIPELNLTIIVRIPR